MKLYIFSFLLALLQLSIITSIEAQYGFSFTEPSSEEACDGKLTATVPASMELPSFSWNNGQSTQVIEDVCFGSYFHVTITDSDGCEFSLSSGLVNCLNNPLVFNREIIHQLGNIKGSIKLSDENGYNYSWENGSTSSEINNLTAGLYKVTITDPNNSSNCNTSNAIFRILKLKPPSRIPTLKGKRNTLSASLASPPLIINEFSNGLSDETEYIELLVTGNSENCDPINIQGYLIDDNNGDFSNNLNDLSNTGITSGHLQFSNSRVWSEVPKGAIILIYNPAIKNPSILLEDDPYDDNQDLIYVLAGNHPLLISNQDIPSINNPIEYTNDDLNALSSSTIPSENWSTIWMYDQGDAIQLRYPNGEFCHGFSYGNTSVINGGPQDLLLDPSHGQGRVFSFISGDINASQSYIVDQVENKTESPGFPNSKNNAIYINSLCLDEVDPSLPNPIHVPYFSTNGQIVTKIYPNPFKDYIQVEIYTHEELDIAISVFDFMGKTILRKQQKIQKGENNFNLKMPSNINHGIYNLLIQSKEEIILDENIIGSN